MNTKQLSKDQFKALALIYASHSDATFRTQEIAFITGEVGEPIYKEVLAHYNASSDYECIQLLLSNKEQFYPGDEGSATLLGEFTALFKADNDYSNLEKNIQRLLVRLLKS